MPFLIDGHNLIPKLGLRLDSMDDEMQLVSVLQEFTRRARREAHVYFDGAPAGRAGTRRYGLVTAHFVRAESTADDAIKANVRKLGGAARNWTVVSSDRVVQREARAAHARVASSEEFAVQLKRMRAPQAGTREKDLTPEEVSEWLKVFGKKG